MPPERNHAGNRSGSACRAIHEVDLAGSSRLGSYSRARATVRKMSVRFSRYGADGALACRGTVTENRVVPASEHTAMDPPSAETMADAM
jgi:hypothetical protein